MGGPAERGSLSRAENEHQFFGFDTPESGPIFCDCDVEV
jgi:hypothetical protein